jgi:uncharacterized protein YecA (UPF0149 family)
MADSQGVSQTGFQTSVAAKMSRPRYVSDDRRSLPEGSVVGDHRICVAQPRNELCRCGSGRKYKNCCGRQRSE